MSTAETAGDGAPLQRLIDAAPLSAIQLRVAALCALVTLVEGIDLNLVPLLAPAIGRQWHLSAAAFGIVFSSGPVGLILGGLGIGWLADRIGRRNALLAAMAVMTLPTLATAYVTSVEQLLVCRLLTGIGFGGVVPAAAALVSEFVPTRLRASVVALVILGQAAGGLLASMALQTSLAQWDWHSLMLWMGALCASVGVLLWAALPESPRYLMLTARNSARLAQTLGRLGLLVQPGEEPAVEAEGLAALKALFAPGRALGTGLLWATFIGVCAAVSFFTSWLPLIVTYAGHSAVEAARVASFYWAGGIVSGIVLPLFALRWSDNGVLGAAILAAAAATAGLGLVVSGTLVPILAMAFAAGAFASGAFYLLYPPVVRFYPTGIRSTGIGAAVAFGRIGNVLSPLAASQLLAVKIAPALVFAAMAVPQLLSLIALAVFTAVTRGRTPE